MAKAPAFQFYPGDWLADENVALMTLEEEGAYIRAMCHCWREGSIPSDPEKLSRLLKNCSNQTRTTVQLCFNQMATDSTRLVHPRLEIERKKQQEWSDKSRAAGIKSGKSRRSNKLHAEPPFTNGSGLVEPNGNSSSSSSSSSSNSKDDEITDPSVATRVVLERCGLSATRAFLEAVGDQAKLAQAAGEDLYGWGELAIKAYLDYAEARPRLEYPLGPERFFATGLYRRREDWKYKNGAAPTGQRKYWGPEQLQ